MSLRKKLIVAGMAVGLLFIVLACFNRKILEMNVTDGQTIYVEYAKDMKLPEITATYRHLLWGRSRSVEVKTEGYVDTNVLGEYTVKCSANYKGKKAEATVTIVIGDRTAPKIELISNPENFTKPNETYVEEGYLAMDEFDGDITMQVVRQEKDGYVYYTVTDSSGNTAMEERQIIYKDGEAPIITLSGSQSMKINIGGSYAEPGYTAIDDCEGDITASVSVDGSVDTSKEGTYLITYHVEDSYGNSHEVVRVVTVADLEAPKLTLIGEDILYIQVGGHFSEPGFVATDNVDGELVNKVVVSHSVDTSKKGLYTINYSVSDSAGNVTKKSRKVYVYEKQMFADGVNPGDKIVYLTFDDGPGKYTEKLLNVLDRFGVKATFFVTNQWPLYSDMIGETYRRGHTIALHTYSHDYSIYTSEEAYYADLEKIRDLCVEQTGVEPKIVRFPGGSSNAISKNYSKGIMTKLTNSISYHGYLYCDWNVSSGDGSGNISTQQVVNNVINGIKGKDVAVVLQHDIYEFSVDAVAEIIAWGLANGYVFLPMDETTPMVHHTPCN